MTHICPHPDCDAEVANEMFACRKHWYSLPQDVRTSIWRAYRQHGVGSTELREAHQRADDFWDPEAADRRRATGRGT